MEADGTVVKRWEILEVVQAEGKPYPKRSMMYNLGKGSHTEMVVDAMNLNPPAEALDPALFTQEGLAEPKEETAEEAPAK